MAQNFFFVSWVSKKWIFISNLTPFASYLSFFHLCGSNLNPDPHPTKLALYYVVLHIYEYVPHCTLTGPQKSKGLAGPNMRVCKCFNKYGIWEGCIGPTILPSCSAIVWNKIKGYKSHTREPRKITKFAFFLFLDICSMANALGDIGSLKINQIFRRTPRKSLKDLNETCLLFIPMLYTNHNCRRHLLM